MRQDHLLSMLSAHQRQTYTLRWTVLGLVLPLLVYAVRALPSCWTLTCRSTRSTPTCHWPGASWRTLASLEKPRRASDGSRSLRLHGLRGRGSGDSQVLESCTGTDYLDPSLRCRPSHRRPRRGCSSSMVLCSVPTLVVLSVWPMAEPPFLFLVALWLWSCTCCLDANASRTLSRAAPVTAGLALGLATLTRATYMYWIPAALLVLCVVACVPRWRKSLPWQGLLAAHLIALACVGSYMALNAHTFKNQ